MPSFSGEELAKWSGGRWDPVCPASLSGVSTNTRTIRPGELYVAIAGKVHDGHNFVEEAFGKGAAGALVGNDYRAGTAVQGRCLLRVPDTLAALQNIAAGYRRDIGVEVVGVTGSAGKTTVKEMTAAVLSALGPVARTLGNFNNDIGVPLSLLSMERGTRIGVFEVGTNHPGELAPLCAMISPRWGLLTNVGPAHLEFFGSVDAIAVEKSTLLKALPADGTAVLCRDGAFHGVLRAAAGCRVVDVSIRGDADLFVEGSSSGSDEVAVREKASGEVFRFRPPVPGDHNICNALFAIAVGRGHGMRWEDIRLGIEGYIPLPMRWAREKIRGVTIINDAYNASPVSMSAALEAFGSMKVAGRKWLVLGGMLELGVADRDLHEQLGGRIGAGDWAGLIAVGAHGSWIAEGARKAGLIDGRIVLCSDNAAAAMALFERATENDAVLLKGSRGMHLEEVRNQYVLLAV